MIIREIFFDKFFEKKNITKTNWFKHLTYEDYQKDIFYNIVDNLYYLMNTQNGILFEDYLSDELNVIRYGIPDFSNLISLNYIDIKIIEKCLRKCIFYFEPRIQDIKIEVISKNKRPIINLLINIKNEDNVFRKSLFFKV